MFLATAPAKGERSTNLARNSASSPGNLSALVIVAVQTRMQVRQADKSPQWVRLEPHFATWLDIVSDKFWVLKHNSVCALDGTTVR